MAGWLEAGCQLVEAEMKLDQDVNFCGVLGELIGSCKELGLRAMDGAVQLMRHDSLSLKIQAASADVAGRMGMSLGGRRRRTSCIEC